jgi:hypothetical protein
VKGLNWCEATLSQLYEIAYNDDGCSLVDKANAVAEIERRTRRKPTNHIQVKINRKRA